MSRECVTHHYACDCREAEFAAIKAERDALRSRIEGAPKASGRYDGGADLEVFFLGAPEEFAGCRWNAMQSEALDGKTFALVVVE